MAEQQVFQSQTGFPGHLAAQGDDHRGDFLKSFNPRRASQAI